MVREHDRTEGFLMASTAFITGADRGLGSALCAGLLERGWNVFAGQYIPDWRELAMLSGRFPESLYIVPLDVSSTESVRAAAQAVAAVTGHIDLLINNAGILGGGDRSRIRQGLDYTAIQRVYDVNALGPIRVVEAFFPLTDQGLRRLVFISSNLSSIAMSSGQGEVGYAMSKTALNMAVKIMFNDLRPLRYTFRLYHPGWVRTYLRGQKYMAATLEPEEAIEKAIPIFLEERDDEDRLVLLNYDGTEWPF
jgi:NAD(P)-dependent dehydrogenase (short-subunit alcohol dehydrogenase family)